MDFGNPFLRCTKSKELESKFRKMNRKYFGGRIRPYKIFVCNSHTNWGHDSRGYCEAAHRRIYLSSQFSQDDSVLLHEMVHAKIGAYHGLKFDSELRRLQRLGAILPETAWRTDDRRISKSRIRTILQNGVTEGYPRKLLRKWLEWETGMPLRELRARYDVSALVQEAWEVFVWVQDRPPRRTGMPRRIRGQSKKKSVLESLR